MTTARQNPAALVEYLVTAYGLGGIEQDLTLRLNAFWAKAVAAERERLRVLITTPSTRRSRALPV